MKKRTGLFVQYCAKDFLDATYDLNPWEELAYRRIVDLIYTSDDRLADDDKKLAWSTKTGSRWPKIKATLIAAGKIEVIDGRISNARCRSELEKTAAKIHQQSVKGKSSAEARKSLKQKDSTPTAVDPRLEPRYQPTNELLNQEDKKEEDLTVFQERTPEPSGVVVPITAQPNPRGTRLDPDWHLPMAWGQWAMDQGLDEESVRWQADSFRDYWIAQPGAKGRKADWQATWRTWVRKSINDGGHHGRRGFAERVERNGFAILNRAIEERRVRSAGIDAGRW